MSFSIQVVVDPGSSKSTIDGLTSSLSAAEAAGPRAGAAISGGMREVVDSAQRAMTAVEEESDAFGLLDMAAKRATGGIAGLNAMTSKFINDPLTQALKEEQRWLDLICAPLAKYESGIAAVDSLLQKNAITTEEWIGAVSKLNRELEKVHPPEMKMPPPPDGSASGLGSTLGVTASVGGAAAALKEIDDLRNGMIDAQNAARKYADATTSVTDVISKNRDMSAAMHSTYAETIALYDKVWTAGRNLYLTNNQLADATQALGIIAKEANQPLDAAEGILKRWTLAADTGTLSQRMMQTAFREMPALADALTKAYGKNEKQLIDLAVAGNIGVRDMLLKLGHQLPQLEESFSHFATTSTEDMRAFAFGLAGIADGTHAFGVLADSENSAAEASAQMAKQNQLVAASLDKIREGVELTKKAIAGGSRPS